MAARSEAPAKLLRAERDLEAADVLEAAGLLEQAAVLQWIALRTAVFAWLEQRNLPYASTRDALVITMTANGLRAVQADLAFAFLVGTMAEWDERFTISSEQLYVYKRRCENVRLQLTS